MEKLQKALNFLTQKYNITKEIKISDGMTAEIKGEKTTVFPWRYERRFVEIKKLIENKTVGDLSLMKIIRLENRGSDLTKMIYRELDLCRYLLNSEIKEVFAVRGGDCINAIVKLYSESICSLEISASLPKGETPIDKHEIITKRGVLCDRVVDTQVPQQSIYVYTDNKKEKYLDNDWELYGLNEYETSIVRCAYDAGINDVHFDFENLKRATKCVFESIEKCENIICD